MLPRPLDKSKRYSDQKGYVLEYKPKVGNGTIRSHDDGLEILFYTEDIKAGRQENIKPQAYVEYTIAYDQKRKMWLAIDVTG